MFGRGGPAPNIKLQPAFTRGEPKVVDSPRRFSRPNSARGSSGQPDNGNVLTGAPPSGGEPHSTPRGRRSSYDRAPSEEIHPRIGRRPIEEPRHEPAPYGKRTYSERRGVESVVQTAGHRGKGHQPFPRQSGEWFGDNAAVSSPRPLYHPSRGCKNQESNVDANREIPAPCKRILRAATPSLVGVLQPVPQVVPKKSYRPITPFYTADE